jgi:hypothetical protein
MWYQGGGTAWERYYRLRYRKGTALPSADLSTCMCQSDDNTSGDRGTTATGTGTTGQAGTACSSFSLQPRRLATHI